MKHLITTILLATFLTGCSWEVEFTDYPPWDPCYLFDACVSDVMDDPETEEEDVIEDTPEEEDVVEDTEEDIVEEDVSPQEEYALRFDGINDCVWIGPLFGGGTTTTATIEMWVRTSTTSELWQRMFAHKDSYRDVGFDWSHGNVRFVFALPSTSYTCQVLWPLADGEWHHLAATLSASTLKLWIDGNLEATETDTGAYMDWGYSLWDTIGCNGPDSQRFEGDMRDIRVSDHARYTIAFVPEWSLEDDSGTEALWKFDEGYGSSADDSSSGDNNGLVDGATWITLP